MLCRYTVAKYKGKEIYLAYTVNAMFRLNDMLKEGGNVLELFEGNNEESLKRFCGAVSVLAGCGAQVRKAEGFPLPDVPDPDELFACLQPLEFVDLKRQSMDAILIGFGREVADEDEEVDLDLAEMEKK